jgi:uncharacterized protein YndB with AHSA1/START domain
MEALAMEGTTLRLTRSFPVKPAEVFRAWTEPEQFRRWFGPPGGSTPSAEMDVRVGGEYRIEMKPPVGRTMYVVGTYLEVEPWERLVFTFGWERMPLVKPEPTRVTVELRDLGDSTELVLTHEQLRNRRLRAWHNFGWTNNLGHLARLLGAGESGRVKD